VPDSQTHPFDKPKSPVTARQDPLLAVADAMQLRTDCRHYRGDRPCEHMPDPPGLTRAQPGTLPPVCSACAHYEPMGTRVLIIKLGALGDVIRTEVILRAVKAQYPRSHITWLTRANAAAMLANNPLIDRLAVFDFETVYALEQERFDLCLSLDKDPAPAALAMRITCPDKRGIGLSPAGTPIPLNPECADYFALGLSNELKFRKNTRTYPQWICQAVGLEYDGRPYRLYPSPENRKRAAELFEAHNIPDEEKVIGLNVGAGKVFANKTWRTRQFVQLAQRLIRRGDCVVALLGGPSEAARFRMMLRHLGGAILNTGCHNSPLDFAAIVERCDVIVTGDTTALHVAVAVGVPVVALFGPTCPAEIDLFGRGCKIVSPAPCAPCYRRRCDKTPNCMDRISIDEVEQHVLEWAGLRQLERARRIGPPTTTAAILQRVRPAPPARRAPTPVP